MRAYFLCIGAAHVDRKAYVKTEARLHTSIPVTTRATLGGVARNVAENAARLGCDTALLSRVGRDKEGEWVRQQASDLGIDVSGVRTSLNSSTASYTAVLEPGGELVLGLADMDIYEEITTDRLDEMTDEIFVAPFWFVDANLPEESLVHLANKARPHQVIFADPVSVPKSKRLLGLFGRINYLFPSRDEAEALSGIAIHTVEDAVRAGELICAMGVKQVVITLGREGVCAVGTQVNRHFSALNAQVQDVTGAGDALIAGFLYAYTQGYMPEDCIECGIAAATLTIECGETVDPQLTPQRLNEKWKPTQAETEPK